MERGQYPRTAKEHIANIEQIVYIAAFAIARDSKPEPQHGNRRGPASRGQRALWAVRCGLVESQP